MLKIIGVYKIYNFQTQNFYIFSGLEILFDKFTRAEIKPKPIQSLFICFFFFFGTKYTKFYKLWINGREFMSKYILRH